jgi:hypothetical protein
MHGTAQPPGTGHIPDQDHPTCTASRPSRSRPTSTIGLHGRHSATAPTVQGPHPRSGSPHVHGRHHTQPRSSPRPGCTASTTPPHPQTRTTPPIGITSVHGWQASPDRHVTPARHPTCTTTNTPATHTITPHSRPQHPQTLTSPPGAEASRQGRHGPRPDTRTGPHRNTPKHQHAEPLLRTQPPAHTHAPRHTTMTPSSRSKTPGREAKRTTRGRYSRQIGPVEGGRDSGVTSGCREEGLRWSMTL